MRFPHEHVGLPGDPLREVAEVTLLRPHELATMLGVSRTTVTRMAEEGSLPFYEVGGQKRFRLAECLAKLRAGLLAGQAPRDRDEERAAKVRSHGQR